MTTVLAQSLRQGFATALGQLETVLQACPDALWQTDLWPDESPTRTHEGAILGSAPWLLASHALVCFDYDLSGELVPWAPPAGIAAALRYADPTRLLTKPELLDWLQHCRERAGATCDGLTDALAATPVPDAHRYAGTPYGVLLGSLPTHVVEHATQIDQFLRRR